MSTHAEHPCPPPFIVLLCLILFSSEMIMISLTAKYECKSAWSLPRPTVCTEASLWSVGRLEKRIFKGKYIKSQTGQFHFLSPARLPHPPIHLSMWSIYACGLINNSSAPGHSCVSAPQKQLHWRKIIVNVEELKLRPLLNHQRRQ